MTALDFVKKIEDTSINTLAIPIVDSNGDDVSVVFDAEKCRFVVYKTHIYRES